jgi:uncharacterized protein (DUF2141 family)
LKKACIFFPFLLILSCAQPGSPSGGPVDETPPEVVSCLPENYKTSFDQRRIEIEFDEFVALKNPSQNVIITPPLTKDPDFTLKGKSLVIEFNTVLDTQTTYVINFGSAIQDLNEGNVLEDFKYIFSTGEYLDSLLVAGTVRSAFLNEVPENMRVHLYEYTEGEDSIPALELPRYFGSVKEDGSFTITNMKPGKYRVFALADANSNYLYDQPNEEVGFADPIILTDSSTTDLLTFLPVPEFKVTRFRHEGYGVLKAAFNRPVDSIAISTAENIPFLNVLSPEKDSAFFYFTPTDLDTLDVVLETLFSSDTSTVRFKSFPKPKIRIQKTDITGGIIGTEDPVHVYFNYPITQIDTSRIRVAEDSTIIPFQCMVSNRDLFLFFKKDYDHIYRISILDSAITGFNGIQNDSLGLTAQTKKEIDLGAFILNFTPPDSSKYIVQLVNAKNRVIAQSDFQNGSDQRFHWIDLIPEKLTLRAIRDENGDGEWTTGSYWNQIQPEPVFYFPETIEIKPNWEIEYNWSENQFNF